MSSKMLENIIKNKGWTAFEMKENEFDLIKEQSIDLAKNQFAVITDLNLIVEVRVTGNELVNPINAIGQGQITIAGILFESFQVNLIHNIDNKLFTYQLKVKAKPVINSNAKIEGTLLNEFTQGGLTRKLISGYALFTTVTKR